MAKWLVRAGMPEPQAEAIVDIIVTAVWLPRACGVDVDESNGELRGMTRNLGIAGPILYGCGDGSSCPTRAGRW